MLGVVNHFIHHMIMIIVISQPCEHKLWPHCEISAMHNHSIFTRGGSVGPTSHTHVIMFTVLGVHPCPDLVNLLRRQSEGATVRPTMCFLTSM